MSLFYWFVTFLALVSLGKADGKLNYPLFSIEWGLIKKKNIKIPNLIFLNIWNLIIQKSTQKA